MEVNVFNVIVEKVSAYTSVSEKEIFSTSRLSHITDARHLIFYLAYNENLTCSYIKRFSSQKGLDLHPSSIKHGIDRIALLAKNDENWKKTIDYISGSNSSNNSPKFSNINNVDLFNAIVEKVSPYTAVSEKEIFSTSRLSPITDARHLIFYLAYNENLTCSYIKRFSSQKGLDLHQSSIKHGIDRIALLAKNDENWKKTIDHFMKTLDTLKDSELLDEKKEFKHFKVKNITKNKSREVAYLSFDKARKYVRSLKLKTTNNWNQYIRSGKKAQNIPHYPNIIYKNNGWIGMKDWLGNSIDESEFSKKNLSVQIVSKGEAEKVLKSEKKELNTNKSNIKNKDNTRPPGQIKLDL